MYDSSYRGLFAVLRIIVIIAIIFLLGLKLYSCINPNKRRRPPCMRNLKQIGLALKQYANDNNEVMPFGEDIEPYQAFGMLHPAYTSEIDIFRCPDSRDKRWDIKSIHEQNNKDGAPFRKDTCKISLSYAYGHDNGMPWTETALSITILAADKYATEDYSNGDNKRRPSNHAEGRNIVCLDGSVTWNNTKASWRRIRHGMLKQGCI